MTIENNFIRQKQIANQIVELSAELSKLEKEINQHNPDIDLIILGGIHNHVPGSDEHKDCVTFVHVTGKKIGICGCMITAHMYHPLFREAIEHLMPFFNSQIRKKLERGN